MRVEYINPFVESAYNVLTETLGGIKVERGELFLKNSTMKIMGVAALVGLAGDVEGRVMFDMTKETALNVANTFGLAAGVIGAGQSFKALDDMAQSALTELANQITGQAVSKLQSQGFKFDLSPPVLFTGDNMEISNTLQVEALIVPMNMGKLGTIEINVVIRERV
ncbi:MAG: chemotaxis protein CheX [Spirochaetaceae bacterium]|jgi:chemotaxis protein CheX|nr:chemotaxis protein CheX [Spirochaetaceae bacterium]